MAKCCFHCMRILVILFNLLFVLVGCAILGIAIFLYVDKTMRTIKDNMDDKKLVVDIMLFCAIGIGGVTIIVSTFGCCGAYHESECLLGTYFFCLFVIVAAEIAAGVVCYLKFDKKTIEDVLNTGIKSTVNAYMLAGDDDAPPEHLKQMQNYLSCCGATGYLDYVGALIPTPSTNKLNKLRKACLTDSSNVMAILADLASNKQMNGCTEKILERINSNKLYVLVTCLIVAFFEIVSMIVAMSLCCTVRRMESGYIGVST